MTEQGDTPFGSGTPGDEPSPGPPLDSLDAELAELFTTEAGARTGQADVPTTTGAVSDIEDADLAELVDLAQRLEAERDEYLDLARRVQAEFENYRKRVEAEKSDAAIRGATRVISELLPVLDACEAAVAHGAAEVQPIASALQGSLAKLGLATVSEVEVAFDPNIHEAVMSLPAADGDEGQRVAEVLRTGYAWNGRVVRAAMVKVRG